MVVPKHVGQINDCIIVYVSCEFIWFSKRKHSVTIQVFLAAKIVTKLIASSIILLRIMN